MYNEVTKVLPNEYDASISYYEVLTRIVNKLNEVIDRLDHVGGGIDIQYNRGSERLIIYEKEIT